MASPLVCHGDFTVTPPRTRRPAKRRRPAPTRRARRVGALVLFLVLGVGCVAEASAQSPEVSPYGWRHSASDAIEIALALDEVRAERARHSRTYARARPRLVDRRWEVSVLTPAPDRGKAPEVVAYVLLDDRSGRVLEAWTGAAVAWPMARGSPGAFGGAINAPWVWVVLSGLFVLPFLRWPPRLLHLDLGVLLAFSASYAAFNAAELDVSVPAVYPLLGYLLARMLWVGSRTRRGTGVALAVPDRVLLFGLVFLIGFRAAVSLSGGSVIDVGYSGVIGADRIAHGTPLYDAFPPDNPHGDTYGPALYAAYVPWELLFPWTGIWDDLPAGRAAAAAFDLAAIALCWLLGRQLGGPRLGLLLAYLWAAYPFTLLVSASGANDALVGAAVLLAVLVASSPVARGSAIALAGLTKFAPFALLPLLSTYGRTLRGAVITIFAAVVVSAILLAPFDLATLWDRTLGFQTGRASPFAIWGRIDAPGLHVAAQVVAIALALAVALLPCRRDLPMICAFAAAVLIAVQICLAHWFYLYLVWFVALTWGALLATPAGQFIDTPGNGALSSRLLRRRPPR
jgi:hypothetical protein